MLLKLKKSAVSVSYRLTPPVRSSHNERDATHFRGGVFIGRPHRPTLPVPLASLSDASGWGDHKGAHMWGAILPKSAVSCGGSFRVPHPCQWIWGPTRGPVGPHGAPWGGSLWGSLCGALIPVGPSRVCVSLGAIVFPDSVHTVCDLGICMS